MEEEKVELPGFEDLFDKKDPHPPFIIMYGEPEFKVYLGKRKFLEMLGLDCEKHSFYVKDFTEEENECRENDTLIVTIYVEGDHYTKSS